MYKLIGLLTVIFALNQCVITESKKTIAIDEDQEAQIRVGVALPFNGDKKELANSIKDTIKLAVYRNKEQQNKHNIKLVYLDEEDKKISDKLVKYNIKTVLGPLLYQHANELSNANPDIKFISFSNNIKIANENISIVGNSPYINLKSILELAVNQNAEKIVIIGRQHSHNLKMIDFLYDNLPKFPQLSLHKLELYGNGNINNYNIKAIADNIQSFKNIDKKMLLLILDYDETNVEEIIDSLKSYNIDYSKLLIASPFNLEKNKMDLDNIFLHDLNIFKINDPDDYVNISQEYYQYSPTTLQLISYYLIADLDALINGNRKNFKHFEVDEENSNILKIKGAFKKLVE